MGVTAVALAVGLVAGLAAGGRPSNAASCTFHLWPALVVGVVLQGVPELLGLEGSAAYAAVACSYTALLAFAAANLRLTGMAVVLVGLALNTAAILPNGGMPVRGPALVQAGIVEPDDVGALDFGSKRHLERDDDVLVVLGDVVPVPPFREVLSIGDLLLSAGLAAVVFRLLRPARSASAPGRGHPVGTATASRGGTGAVVLRDGDRLREGR